MKRLTFLLALFFSFSLFAQNGPVNPLSVRSHGVGNASVTFSDINSIFNNQAGLAGLENIGILFSGQESFRGPNSDNLGAGVAIPTSFGTIGTSIHYFENNDIKQGKFGFTYARKLMENLSLGVQFDVVHNQMVMNQRRTLYTFELGLQYQLNEKLVLGIHFYNPSKLEIIENEFLPQVLRAGATYFASKKIMIHAELEKDFDFPIVFKSGIEWELVNDLYFRCGFQHKPTNLNAGMGYQFKNGLRLDLACYYQEGLDIVSSGLLGSSGLVPSIGVGFDFIKK